MNDAIITSYLLGRKKSGGGEDLTKYFNSSFSETSNNKVGWTDLVKKIPEPVTVSTSSMSFAFAYCNYIPQFTLTNASSITEWNQSFCVSKDTRKLDLSSIPFSDGCNTFQNMFFGSYFEEIDMSSLGKQKWNVVLNSMFYRCRAKKINLCNFDLTLTGSTASHMFDGCTQLEELDISSLDFSKLDTFTLMFYDVPTNCLILVKDQTQVNWFATNFPELTNVQIKS